MFVAIRKIEMLDISCAVVISDSLGALRAIENCHPRSCRNKLIWEIKELIISLDNQNKKIILVWVPGHTGVRGNEKADWLADNHNKKIILVWVPGHTGVRGNEKADWLAKRVRALRCSNIRLDATNFYHQFRKQMFKEWQKWWEISREFIVTFNRIRLGHCWSETHLFRIGVIASPLCSCGDVGDIEHRFFNCSNYKQAIDILIKDLVAVGCNTPLKSSYLMSAFCNTRMQHLI
ncbi:RNase H [Popillia japonica]|uniref:ribonuclease H n=1 Tax=Popillia japonica TaxID=7064 RepID=A0AAW1KNT5_POPJA